RLADAGLAYHRGHLTAATTGKPKGITKLRQLARAPDKLGQTARSVCVEARADRVGSGKLVNPNGALSPFTRIGPRALTWTKSMHSTSVVGVSKVVPASASCSIRLARCVFWPTAV